MNPAELAERAELAKLFHDVFYIDVRGRKVLEYLERKYATAPAVVVDGGIDAVLKTYRKAAHREVLDHIQNQIGRYLDKEAPAAETPEVKIGD